MKALEKSFNRYYDRVLKILSVPRNHFKPEHFHKLRVNIKKINALLLLTEYCIPAFERKKHFKSLRIIFQQAGRVREIQLQIKILKSYSSLPGILPYLKLLKNELSVEKEKFFSMAIVPISFKSVSIAKAMSKTKKEEVIKYLKKKEKRIRKYVQHNKINLEKLHRLRIELKRWIYCLESLKMHVPEKLITLAEDLGKWHDCYVNQQQITAAMNYDRLPIETIRSLNILQKGLRLKEKKLLTGIQQSMAMYKKENSILSETHTEP